jgi:hypothetical protein
MSEIIPENITVPIYLIPGDLRQLPEENDVVPLRSFLLLTFLHVGLGSSKAEGTNGASVPWVIFLPKYSPLERFSIPSFSDS